MAATWTQTQQRIVREASELTPIKVLVTIIAFPFFVVGLLFGLVWVICTLVWQSVWVGITQTRATLTRD